MLRSSMRPTRSFAGRRQLSSLYSALEAHPNTPSVSGRVPTKPVVTSSTLANGIKIVSRQTDSPVRPKTCFEGYHYTVFPPCHPPSFSGA